MGFPINPDGTIDYGNPAPIPTRLTDGAAEYGEPSEQLTEILANEYLHSMALMCARICKNTSGNDAIERMMILFSSIERKAAEAERARLRAKAQGHLDKCNQNATTAPEDEADEWEDNAYSWSRFIYVMFDKQ